VTGIFKLYYEALQGFRWKAFNLIILSALSGLLEGAALTTLMPLLNQHLKSLSASSFELFGKAYEIRDQYFLVFGIIALFCFLGLLSACAKLLMEWKALQLRVALERLYNERLVHAVLSANWTTFLSIRFGDIAKGINMESRHISYGAAAVISMCGLCATALIFLILGYALSPNMTVLTFGFGGLMWVVYRLIFPRFKNHPEVLSSISSEVNHEIQQLLGNLKFMRSTGLSNYILTRMSSTFRNYENVFVFSFICNPILRFVFEICGVVFVSVIIAASVWGAPASLGRVLIFLAVFYRLAPRISLIQEQYGVAINYQGWCHSWNKMYELLSEKPDSRVDRKQSQVPHFDTSIEARDIGFKYAGRPVLKSINWILSKGKCIAFVGESGSGKTTMTDLVTGIIETTEGQLLIDGVSSNDLDLQAWQSRIGLVMSNSPMFHATVFENIVWGDSNPDLLKAEEAAKSAHAWEFIMRLPEGFKASVGDKGAQFSTGECQRIALARALYRNPWLLVLDEATNALDAESESIIHETLLQLKGRMTIFMVAHRLQSAQLADEILVLDQGEIIERGTYQELLHRPDGRFRKLAQLQGL
jgi:ABC-type multidrug transport system fused ATPase/permease subunit